MLALAALAYPAISPDNAFACERHDSTANDVVVMSQSHDGFTLRSGQNHGAAEGMCHNAPCCQMDCCGGHNAWSAPVAKNLTIGFSLLKIQAFSENIPINSFTDRIDRPPRAFS